MIFSGTSNLELAKGLAQKTGLKLGRVSFERFSDGELYVKVNESLRGKNILVMQSLNFPAGENLIELLILVDALKDLAPKKITALLPFFAYRRQERKLLAGESAAARLIAKLIEAAGVDEVVLVDIHSDKILDFFRIPAANIELTVLFADYFKGKKLPAAVVVAPDKGALADTRRFADLLGLGTAAITKKRTVHDAVQQMELAGDVEGKNVIMVDDEIDTAGTITKAARLLKDRGAKDIYVACTHGVLSGPAVERLKNSPIKEVAITDSIKLAEEKSLEKIKIISIVPALADWLRKNKKV